MIVFIIAIVGLSALWCLTMLEKRELAENLRDAYTALDECNGIMRMQRENIESSGKIISMQKEFIKMLEEKGRHDD